MCVFIYLRGDISCLSAWSDLSTFTPFLYLYYSGWGGGGDTSAREHNGDLGLLSKNTGTGTAAHFLCYHHCVWFPCHTSSTQWWIISSSQLVLRASYAGGKHRVWLALLLGGHVETTMCVYGEIRQCTWQCQLLLRVWPLVV